NIAFEDEPPVFGEDAIQVGDPSGLVLRLVASDDARAPWLRKGIGANEAIRGVHSVKLLVRDPAETIAFVQDLMGGQVVGEEGDRTRVAINGSAPGHLIELERAGDAPAAINGLGTVHHVAFAVETAAAQLEV